MSCGKADASATRRSRACRRWRSVAERRPSAAGSEAHGALLQRAGLSDLEIEDVNEPPVTDERHDAPAEVDDLGLGEITPQLVEQRFGRRAMVSGENLRVVDGRLLAVGQQLAVSVV